MYCLALPTCTEKVVAAINEEIPNVEIENLNEVGEDGNSDKIEFPESEQDNGK